MDDTTLSEIIGKDAVSQMETFFGDVLDRSALNLMNINVTKTKETIVGVNVNPPPQEWRDHWTSTVLQATRSADRYLYTYIDTYRY